MATENQCPHCGKPVPATALQGICPECLLKAGLVETGELELDGTPVTPTPFAMPRLEDLAAQFPQLEILECLGRGGMGSVYKARQPKLDRFVALKVLSRKRDRGMPDAEFAERFQREARALARLSHPDIVAVYEFGEAGGFHYLLMEYVDGLTLRQLLQTRKLSPEEALAIVPKICEALQFAHDRGIVHRDIKPENILLDKQGRLKIADFGIAKIAGPAGGVSLTQDKQVIGTPHYMAPEQIEKPAQVDHRADIFSLGVVFYEMLTGELPLGKFPPPSRKVQVDVRLDEVVLHALEKEPERRYQHASEVKTAVETIAATPVRSQRAEAPAAAPEMHPHRPAPTATRPWLTAMRWTARGLASLWVLLFLALVAGEGSPPLGKQPVAVQIEFAALALMFAGCVTGWWRDRPAALLTLGGWLLFHAAEKQVALPSLFHVPLLAGFLFAVSAAARQPTDRRRFGGLAAFVLIPLLAALLLNTGAFKSRPVSPETASEPVSLPPDVPVSAVSAPPVVTETFPVSGTADVDSALTELRVTFSKPMRDGGWSWVKVGDETFPTITATPRFLPDQQTCVLPVKLSAGKLYAVWVNHGSATNFQDAAGQAALSYLLIFQTRK